MADTRGVFRLDRVRTRSVKGTWVTPEQAFESILAVPPNVGYSGGGQGPSVGDISSFTKTNFTDDTSSGVPSANLIANTTNTRGLGNPSNGYIMGGGLPVVSTTNKLSYASETVSASPGSAMAAGRYTHGTIGRQEFAGYVVGGGNPNYLSPKSDTQKLIYAVDTFHLLPAAFMTAAGMQVTGASNTTQGIFGTGASPAGPGLDSAFNKLTYSSETTALVPGVNTINKSRVAANGNDTHGYFAGGETSGILSTITKYTYSSDTIADISDKLTIPKMNAGASGNSAFGYVIAGLNNGTSPTTFYSSVDKINFATDGVARAPGANLPSPPRGTHGSICGRGNGQNETKKSFAQSTQNLKSQLEAPNTGYLTGGEPGPGPYLSSTEKLNLSTETTSALPASSLPDATYGLAAFSSPGALYATGGNTPGGTQSRIAKLSYSTDTYAYTGNSVSAARISVTATDTSTAGYLAGGGTAPTYYSLISKIAYATETSRDLPAANLSIARGTFASGGNQSFGYFAGGEYPAPNTHTSRIDKVSYNTETSSIIPDNLTQSKFGLLATGGPEAVYFTQGYSPAISSVSTTNKVSYSTDTVQNLPSSYSSFAGNDGQGGSGNKSYGYWGGASPAVTSVNRVDYSTDVTVRVPGMNMFQGRNRMGGAGARSNDKNDYRTATPTPTTLFPNAPNTGYWAGGEAPRVSNVDKIEYASETVSRSPYGTPELRNGFDGTGDTEKAFYLGGFNPSGPGATSTVQKLVYATDVWSAAPNLNERRYFAAVTGDLDAGYNSGGAVPATSSRTEKITFSTEATSLVPGANLSAARYSMGNVSNQTSGYALGGAPGPYSRVDKMTFSSETFAYTPGANLSVAKGLVASTGNASVALLIGGQTASKVSDADKLTFSTDTTSAVPSANLPTATGNCSGSLTGNGLNGYFAGGNDGSGTTAMYKVSFSTETTQYTPGRLSFARWNLASSSALESNQVTGVAPVL